MVMKLYKYPTSKIPKTRTVEMSQLSVAQIPFRFPLNAKTLCPRLARELE